MPEIAFIYGLADPITDECKYIGKSKYPEIRLREHLHPKRLEPNTYRNNWVKKLLRDNHKPDLFIVEQVTEENWKEAEKFWISYFRSIGAILTNSTTGGEGGNIGVEGHRKQAEALKGRKVQFSQEHIDSLTNLNKSRARDPIMRAKMSESAKKRHLRNPNEMRERAVLGRAAPRKPPFEKTCDLCDKPFMTTTNKSHYCSYKCGVKARKSGITVRYN